MLCGTADVVDPELMQPGCTPPEGSGPLSVLPRVCRAEVRCRRVFPVWKSSFSPRHSGYIESRTCRVAERERTAEKQVRCQYRLTTASTCHGSDKRSRSTCRTWNRCQSQYEEADDEICRIPFVVAREVQCDGRMAMEIERAGVQNRLYPLMVSVPESFSVAGRGVAETSLWCCSIRSEFRGRDPQWSRSGWRAGAGVHGGARRGARR